MKSGDSIDGTKPHSSFHSISGVPSCELVSSVVLTRDNCAEFTSSFKQDAVLPKNPKPDRNEGMVIEFEHEKDPKPGMVVGFIDDKRSLEWLKKVYTSESISHEWARRFLYRSRLARMTKDWSDNHILTRDVARRLPQAIIETANVLTTQAIMKEGWTRAKVFCWPIQSRLPQASYPPEGEARRGLFYLTIRRDHSDLRWTVDESELEAVLGLWAWTLNEQISRICAKSYETVRILSTQSSDGYDLNLWREPGGTPLIEGSLSKISHVPSLLCGLQNLSNESSDDHLIALKVDGTIPGICAQELYSLFLLAFINAAVADFRGEPETQKGLGTFFLQHTTISSVQEAFAKHGLGFGDDVFACAIPAFISSAKLPSFLGTLPNGRKTASNTSKSISEKWRRRLYNGR